MKFTLYNGIKSPISLRILMNFRLNYLNLIEEAVKYSTQIRFANVPSTPHEYLKHVSKIKVVKKFLHKFLLLKFGKQIPLWLDKLPHDSRVLWLYTGKRNFGDAIMDLSGRSLLKKYGGEIDLLTFDHLEKLFGHDDIFKKIYTDPKDVNPNNYTHILLSEFNLPSIRNKIKYFKKLPFACLYGFFYGPDRNQILFSHTGINHTFSLGYSNQDITSISKPYLASNKIDISNADGVVFDDSICICIGGIDSNRTYDKWWRVIELIDHNPNLPKNIFLLGSENGLQEANKLTSLSFDRIKIISYVNKLSLLESRQIINMSDLYIGCDGGLLHVAHTTSTPTISLFNVDEHPNLRITSSCQSFPLHSSSAVSNITPTLIYEAVLSKFKHA